MPAFVSLLCICIVFVPMFFLEGVAASCSCRWRGGGVRDGRSSSLAHAGADHGEISAAFARSARRQARAAAQRRTGAFSASLRSRFDRMAAPLPRILASLLAHRRMFVICFLAFVLASFVLLPFLGRDFFPAVDAGQIRMHARPGRHADGGEQRTSSPRVQEAIRKIVPPDEVDVIVDNIGLPPSGINLTYNNTGLMGAQDGDILVALKRKHQPTAATCATCVRELPRQFPGITFFFQPADIVSQILNFGSPAPIDVQIRGNNGGE